MTVAAPAPAEYKPAGLWTPDELDALEGNPLPRIGTPRRPAAGTLGPVLSALDDAAGFEFSPWQRHVADVALEVDERQRWLHRVVVLAVARQNGKTAWAARRILAGLFAFDDSRILHTAQDRAMPREVFEELAGIIDGSRSLRRHVKSIRYANGQESVKLRNGSWYRIVAPSQSAVRGWPRVGLVVMDEAREYRDDALFSAAQYTQRAHPNPQLLVLSNAGDPDSIVLNRLRDRGRAAAADPGADPGIAYFEYSSPDDAEPDNPLAWIPANPHLGLTMRGSTLLEELRTDTPLRFRTEAMCQWVDVTTRNAVPWAEWERCADRDLEPVIPGEARTFAAVDVDPDHGGAALLMGSWVAGVAVVAAVATWAPASELEVAAAVDELMAQFGAVSIAYDPYTCQGIVDRTGGKDRYPWLPVSGTKWVAACAELADVVRQSTLRHPDQPVLNEQVAAAGRRDVGDGTWRMSRIDSEVPIPAAIALARLVYAMLEDRGAPEIFVL